MNEGILGFDMAGGMLIVLMSTAESGDLWALTGLVLSVVGLGGNAARGSKMGGMLALKAGQCFTWNKTLNSSNYRGLRRVLSWRESELNVEKLIAKRGYKKPAILAGLGSL